MSLATIDPIYFNNAPWAARVQSWIAANGGVGFAAGNRETVEQVLNEPEAGLRVVVNIGVAGLSAMLDGSRYMNLYERPVVGGSRRGASPERLKVDQTFGLGDDVYFGALALGGAGVRYYGEYCMVLDLKIVPEDTQLLDRDSYDVLLDPLRSLANPREIERLLGTWSSDRQAMVLMRVLPELTEARRLITTGSVSEMVLKDQEFIEVHLMLPGSFTIDDVEEIRESPDEVAIEASLSSREQDQQFLTAVQHEWLQRRRHISSQLERERVENRVVTMHGRGYQWK